MIADIVAVLGKHRLIYADGLFRCTCMEQVYSPYGKNRAAAAETHDIHVAQQLKAAGMTITPHDPRAAFRARARELNAEGDQS